MEINRIVSFLPSATELLYELGVQDRLYGVTHECTYPEDAKTKPQVIRSVIDSNKLSSKEIDQITCQLFKDGKDIFVINEENLRNADPDIIISQETCEVCAAYTNQVNKAVQILQKKPNLHSMDPHNLEDIIQSITEMGKILQKENKAREIVESLRKRLKRIKNFPTNKNPRILAIEWIEPFFTAGHWIPEMIEAAGGINLISKAGEYSRRLSISEIRDADPDIIILMPCGFDTKRTVLEYNQSINNNQDWNDLRAVKNGSIFAVDANSYFSKPSIRVIIGIEILAKIIQDRDLGLKFQKNSFTKIA